LKSTVRSKQPGERAAPLSPVHRVVANAAEDLFSRLLRRYLPDPEKDFVYDDSPISKDPAPASDPHHTLGLPPGASAEQVRRRVRQLARVFHPDLPDGNAQKMAEINEAADQLLRGPERRETR
jgi:hypothetical protein